MVPASFGIVPVGLGLVNRDPTRDSDTQAAILGSCDRRYGGVTRGGVTGRNGAGGEDAGPAEPFAPLGAAGW